MTKLTPAQLKRFRFFRNKGFGVSESRRLARMTTDQMATELSRRLRNPAVR
jgi:hypothetical protein